MDPLYLFVFLGLFTPGPNVILLTTSGARFGFTASLRHVAGVALGVGILAGLAGMGIGAVLEALPALRIVLSVLAAGWILLMAVRLWNARPRMPQGQEGGTADRPWGVGKAVLFQWVNPKVWAVVLAAASGYASGLPPMDEALRLAAVFAGTNLFVCLFWTYSGSLLARLLRNETAWRRFVRVMALGLGASAVMVFT